MNDPMDDALPELSIDNTGSYSDRMSTEGATSQLEPNKPHTLRTLTLSGSANDFVEDRREAVGTTGYTLRKIAQLIGVDATVLEEDAQQFAGMLLRFVVTEEQGSLGQRYARAAVRIFQTIRQLREQGVDSATIWALLDPGTTHAQEGQTASHNTRAS